MKNLIIISAAAIALVSCNKPKHAPKWTDPGRTEPGTLVTANGSDPGIFDITAPDGTKFRAILNADGTYTDMAATGERIAHGTWKVTAGKTCFSPDGGTGPECFAETPVGADGTYTATSEKGESLTVKRWHYRPKS